MCLPRVTVLEISRRRELTEAQLLCTLDELLWGRWAAPDKETRGRLGAGRRCRDNDVLSPARLAVQLQGPLEGVVHNRVRPQSPAPPPAKGAIRPRPELVRRSRSEPFELGRELEPDVACDVELLQGERVESAKIAENE
jgi:hypothetical protein